jgi:hypothetical protein
MRNITYQEAVGSLMLFRWSHAFPRQAHWEAVKQIFRYLKWMKDYWLTYGGQQMELKGYADADGSMAEDRHAISGYTFLLHGGAISWAAK